MTYLVYSEKNQQELYQGDDREQAFQTVIDKSPYNNIVLLHVERRSWDQDRVCISRRRFRGGHEDREHHETVDLLGNSQLEFVVEQLLGLQKEPSE